ncbi:MAG: extracellular solute-binding protein [Chloroflexia bacterium]|nr:extracellular solute-binding protein [Chloroflexia bacterium]MDQ3512429.1 extracellular solute-binding protein [Chloroflexota bacterium]
MRETNDRRDKLAIAKATEAYRRGAISRRQMMKVLGAAGVALSASPRIGRAASRPNPTGLAALQASTPPAEVTQWLTDVGGQFSGTTIKVVSEETPPSRAIINLLPEQFEAVTGITVEWEVVPLDQVLQKVSVDAAGALGANDIYYFDQAWVGRFINDTFDPRELLETKPDLAYPNYAIDDFLEPLVTHIASYDGKMIGLPCDVPIFMYFYRQDIYDTMGLTPATTMQQYMDNAKAINDEMSAQGTYGTVGQMKSGHYSLECDMTAWLWSHGGSIFNADGQCVLNDEAAIVGLDYMRTLQTYMPSAVTTYDWGGQFTAIQQGQGGQVITWGEDFPGWDDPANSQVSGLMTPAPLPAAASLRTPEECGFEESPELGHQGGSTYCLSRYSKQADAAWVFLQWATSAETQAQASIIGGGASPMRQSTFDDPRVQAAAQVGAAGTTRHFPEMNNTIMNRMGTEPHLPQWPVIATDVIAVELGKLTAGQYASTQEGADEITRLVNEGAAD